MAWMFGWIVIVALISLILMQTVYVGIYCRFLRSSVDVCIPPDSNAEPRTAVILCLRGTDPSLQACLEGLIRQDYANYEIHVVVDNEHDPALECVNNIDPPGHLRPISIHMLNPETASNCSLKCAAITTAISALDDSVQVIALIDADTIADPKWLTDLLMPLADPSVGASTGNRWFAPETEGLGSFIRQVWNGAAVPQMSFYQIPWGGSLAIKRSTIETCNLAEAWNSAFCEDTMLTNILKQHNLRVVRIPLLIICNQESTSVSDTYRWIVRQLLTIRLYHRDWPLVLIHGMFSAGCLSGSAVMIVVLPLSGQAGLAWGVVVALASFQILNAVLLNAIATGNESAITQRGVELSEKNRSLWHYGFSIFMTQWIHPIAVIRAATTRRVTWRGITYLIAKDKTIKMLRYVPFRDTLAQPNDADNTLNSID